jgi:hypothetical protein
VMFTSAINRLWSFVFGRWFFGKPSAALANDQP